MRLYDNHIHSRMSADSKMEMSDIAIKAHQRGLAGVCFTDHYDFDIPEGVCCFTFDPQEQREEVEKTLLALPAEVASSVRLLRGVEIGMQPHCIEEMNALVAMGGFDTVVGSLHFIDGTDPFHGNYYIPYDYKQAYGHYLETIWDCIEKFDDFDIIGHYDYIARYAPYPETTILYSEFGDILDTILKKLAQNGKTFEINTKTYMPFAGGREPQLDTSILTRFRELGGEFISFGSDAHDIERVGANFERFAPIVKSCGIKYCVRFEQRVAKPELI